MPRLRFAARGRPGRGGRRLSRPPPDPPGRSLARDLVNVFGPRFKPMLRPARVGGRRLPRLANSRLLSAASVPIPTRGRRAPSSSAAIAAADRRRRPWVHASESKTNLAERSDKYDPAPLVSIGGIASCSDRRTLACGRAVACGMWGSDSNGEKTNDLHRDDCSVRGIRVTRSTRGRPRRWRSRPGEHVVGQVERIDQRAAGPVAGGPGDPIALVGRDQYGEVPGRGQP
jgi:hypothetical protein